MREMHLIENCIQGYEWGSATAFTELLGLPNPDGGPQAELWMGAHPKAPSRVLGPFGRDGLDALIERHPREVLGEAAARRFNGRLPFLFKVLAAARPLSLQAHPDREAARRGFERENRLGIAVGAPQRNYRDPNHKPECLCALTPFWALSGFRPPAEILGRLRRLCPRALADDLERFEGQCDAAGLRRLFAGLLRLGPELRPTAIAEALSNADRLDAPARDWVCALARHYPADIGVLAPALLNLVRMDPGQALFMPAGILHTYLDGVGVEIMANSDNVVRGGLTPKHVDVDELLEVLRFDVHDCQLVESIMLNQCEKLYAAPAEEFSLSVIRVRPTDLFESLETRSIEMLLCTEGRGTIAHSSGGTPPLELVKGTSLVVPAAAKGYRIRGDATLFKATVPQAGDGR